MNVLCIDHACHKKTKSFDFFVDVLRAAGMSVEVYYYERHYRVKPPRKLIDWADTIVYLEFLPSRFRLLFPGKKTVYLPMYDNEWGSKWQWRRIAWSGMGVVSFSKKVSDHARKCGVSNLLEVQYFLDPSRFPQGRGEPKRVFLWERGDIDRHTAEILFPPSQGYVFDIKRRDEFLERDDYLNRIAKCEIMIAPRRKEGIGMVFLEAIAMGKCIAAHDDATMNEYIENGNTGILFRADDPRPVSYGAVACVCENINRRASELWAKWQGDSMGIVPFMSSQRPCRPSFSDGVKLLLSFPLFLVEGLWWRLFL